MIFRQNLTELDMQADRLARELDSLTTRADNVSMDALSLNESFAAYLAEVERRRGGYRRADGSRASAE